MRGVNGAEYGTGEIVASWTKAGLGAGAAIGGTYGTALFPVFGTVVGAVVGLVAGLVVGFLDGLLLAWIRPSPGDVPLVAEAATELIVLPLQIWLWTVIHSAVFLPAVVAPTVVSVAVAALLGRRLPPGPGPGRSGGSRPRRTIADTARWWSIEVMRGEASAFRWQKRYDSALTEAALASGARDGVWHADRRGVVFQVLFDTEEQWEAFLGLPVVRAALAAVPDPVNGLLIYRSGGAVDEQPLPSVGGEGGGAAGPGSGTAVPPA
jgi:hypothetical protein